jgi:hypothetical protein
VPTIGATTLFQVAGARPHHGPRRRRERASDRWRRRGAGAEPRLNVRALEHPPAHDDLGATLFDHDLVHIAHLHDLDELSDLVYIHGIFLPECVDLLAHHEDGALGAFLVQS